MNLFSQLRGVGLLKREKHGEKISRLASWPDQKQMIEGKELYLVISLLLLALICIHPLEVNSPNI